MSWSRMRPSGVTVLGAYAALVAVAVAAPMMIVVIAGATSASYVSFPPPGLSLRWYVGAAASETFRSALVFSLQIAALVAVAAGVLGVTSAIALREARFPGRAALHTFLMAPMMLPHLVLAVGLLHLFSLIGVSTSPWGLLAGHIVIALPFVVRLALAGLAGLDESLVQASYALGASPLRTFLKISMPLAGPAIGSAVVFAFLLSFDESGLSIFLSLPGRTTLPATIYEYATQTADPLVTAAGAAMVVLGIGIAAAAERFFGLLALLAGGSRPRS